MEFFYTPDDLSDATINSYRQEWKQGLANVLVHCLSQ